MTSEKLKIQLEFSYLLRKAWLQPLYLIITIILFLIIFVKYFIDLPHKLL